jgi:acyl-CoA synthetase (NDP forming)
MQKLEKMFEGVPVILKNPLDAAAFGYTQEGYGQVAELVISDAKVDILVAMHALHKNWKFAAPQLVALKERYHKPIIACYISTQSGANENRSLLQAAGIPCFTSVERAAWGIAGCIQVMRLRHGR